MRSPAVSPPTARGSTATMRAATVTSPHARSPARHAVRSIDRTHPTRSSVPPRAQPLHAPFELEALQRIEPPRDRPRQRVRLRIEPAREHRADGGDDQLGELADRRIEMEQPPGDPFVGELPGDAEGELGDRSPRQERLADRHRRLARRDQRDAVRHLFGARIDRGDAHAEELGRPPDGPHRAHRRLLEVLLGLRVEARELTARAQLVDPKPDRGGGDGGDDGGDVGVVIVGVEALEGAVVERLSRRDGDARGELLVDALLVDVGLAEVDQRATRHVRAIGVVGARADPSHRAVGLGARRRLLRGDLQATDRQRVLAVVLEEPRQPPARVHVVGVHRHQAIEGLHRPLPVAELLAADGGELAQQRALGVAAPFQELEPLDLPFVRLLGAGEVFALEEHAFDRLEGAGDGGVVGDRRLVERHRAPDVLRPLRAEIGGGDEGARALEAIGGGFGDGDGDVDRLREVAARLVHRAQPREERAMIRLPGQRRLHRFDRGGERVVGDVGEDAHPLFVGAGVLEQAPSHGGGEGDVAGAPRDLDPIADRPHVLREDRQRDLEVARGVVELPFVLGDHAQAMEHLGAARRALGGEDRLAALELLARRLDVPLLQRLQGGGDPSLDRRLAVDHRDPLVAGEHAQRRFVERLAGDRLDHHQPPFARRAQGIRERLGEDAVARQDHHARPFVRQVLLHALHDARRSARQAGEEGDAHRSSFYRDFSSGA